MPVRSVRAYWEHFSSCILNISWIFRLLFGRASHHLDFAVWFFFFFNWFSFPLNKVHFCHFPVQYIDFLLWLFAASVVAWADHGAALLLGLSANWSPWKHQMTPGLSEDHIGKHPTEKLAVQETLTLLPSSLSLLLAKEPWKEQTQKVNLNVVVSIFQESESTPFLVVSSSLRWSSYFLYIYCI